MEELRTYRRVIFRYKLFFGMKSLDYPGIMQDISMNGMHISSETPIPPGTKIIVGFGKEADEIECKIRGESTWIISPKGTGPGRNLHHMGIKIIGYDDRFLEFLGSLISKRKHREGLEKEPREYVRYEHQVEIIFESMHEILHQVTHNISKGGLFISTDKPFEKGTVLWLRIVIPHIMEDINVKGKVAFSIDLKTAAKHQRPPGMGIKFIMFAKGDGKKFAAFIKKLSLAASQIQDVAN